VFSFVDSYETSETSISSYILYVNLLVCSDKLHLQFLDVLLQLLRIKLPIIFLPLFETLFIQLYQAHNFTVCLVIVLHV
jgi:hypothetical protein